MGTTLTMNGLSTRLAASMGMSKGLAKDVVSCLFEQVEQAVKNETPVAMGSLGTLKVVRRKARTCRNPQTGEQMQVPEKVTVRFKPSSALSRELNPVTGLNPGQG